MDQNVHNGSDLPMFFYFTTVWHYCTNFKAPKLKKKNSQDNGLWSTLHFLENFTNYIYSKFHNNLLPFWAVMGKCVKQDSDFPMHLSELRRFDITVFLSETPKLQAAVKILTSAPPFFGKYNLYIYIYT